MPTIDRVGPYRMFFYANEGDEPPHVHVQRERMLAKFRLQPVELASARGFAANEQRRIERIVAERAQTYLEKWHDFFG